MTNVVPTLISVWIANTSNFLVPCHRIASNYSSHLSGSYCPASTDLVPLTSPKPCPVGYYGARDGLTSDSECTICPAGKYCASEGEWKSSFRILVTDSQSVRMVICGILPVDILIQPCSQKINAWMNCSWAIIGGPFVFSYMCEVFLSMKNLLLQGSQKQVEIFPAVTFLSTVQRLQSPRMMIVQ